jgi:Ca-activated chloride channel homolog
MMNEVVLPRIDDKVESLDSQEIGRLVTERGNLPMCGLGYQTQIRGLAVRTEITQTFYNPFDRPIEATYVFPIEGTMAVVDCLMIVGERIIRADLQERSAARQRYRDAIRRGHRAALLEENRSETFSLSVGNIPPGEAIRIRLITVGQLSVVNSVWTLRLPLVVAPRYTSGLGIPQFSAGSGTTPDTDEAPDASHVTPPVLLPGCANPVDLSVSVDIDLESLNPVADWHEHLASSLHAVVLDGDAKRCRVRIEPGHRVDRDFILRGSIASDQLRTAGRMERSKNNGRRTFAIHLTPPKVSVSDELGRDVVFVLDRSGSMSGWKYVAAQRGIARLIDALNDRDRFGLIVFDDQQLCFTDPSLTQNPKSLREAAMGGASLITATDKNRFAAIKWLNKISVNGGTEMAPAIELALDMIALFGNRESKGSIVLVTDGQITGEDFVLSRLKDADSKRRPRIYTLGVDRAVNASVLRRLSTLTGGTFELVESEMQLDAALQVMAQEIGTPVLTKIQIESGDLFEPVFGSSDLYTNRPVTIFGRTEHDALTVRLSATDRQGNPWRQDVSMSADDQGATNDVLLSLWGKGRVRMLEDQYAISGEHDEAAQSKIIETSLESRVLSRFTAYVAVDEREIVNESGSFDRVVQPVELPEGWQLGRLPVIPPEMRIKFGRRAPRHKTQVASATSDAFFADFCEPSIELNEIAADEMPLFHSSSFKRIEARAERRMMAPRRDWPASASSDFWDIETFLDPAPVDRLPSDKASWLIQPLVRFIFVEAEKLRATQIFFQKTNDSIEIKFLVGEILQEHTHLPLRLWRQIVHLVKLFPSSHTKQDDVWQGDFLAADSPLFCQIVSLEEEVLKKLNISIRIERDDKIEIQLS